MSKVSIDKKVLSQYADKIKLGSNFDAFISESASKVMSSKAELEEFYTHFNLPCGEVQTNRDNRLIQHKKNLSNVISVQATSLSTVLSNIVAIAENAELEASALLGVDVSGLDKAKLGKVKKSGSDANIDLTTCKTTQDYVDALKNGSTTPSSLASYLATTGMSRLGVEAVINTYLTKGNKANKDAVLKAALDTYDEQVKATTKKQKVKYSSTGSSGKQIPNMSFAPLTIAGRTYTATEFNLPEEQQKFLQDICKDAGVDYYLACAIMTHETSCDPNKGNDTHKGLMAVATNGTAYTENMFKWYSGNGCATYDGTKARNVTGEGYFSSGAYDSAEWLAKAKEAGANTSDVYDPYTNMVTGVSMLRDNMDKHGSTYNALYRYAASESMSTTEILYIRDCLAKQSGEEVWNLEKREKWV